MPWERTPVPIEEVGVGGWVELTAGLDGFGEFHFKMSICIFAPSILQPLTMLMKISNGEGVRTQLLRQNKLKI